MRLPHLIGEAHASKLERIKAILMPEPEARKVDGVRVQTVDHPRYELDAVIHEAELGVVDDVSVGTLNRIADALAKVEAILEEGEPSGE